MTSALLALILAGSDAPVPEFDVHPVKVAVVRHMEQQREVEVTGGCWISSDDCLSKARERAACCAEAERLKKGHISPPWGVVLGTVGGFIGGVVLTVIVVNQGKL